LKRSGGGSDVFGVLAGAIPVAIAVGILLIAVWRWRTSGQAGTAPTVATSASGVSQSPVSGDGAASARASAASTAGDVEARPDRARGKMDELLARAREEDDAAP
jgi:hypothetical protein